MDVMVQAGDNLITKLLNICLKLTEIQKTWKTLTSYYCINKEKTQNLRVTDQLVCYHICTNYLLSLLSIDYQANWMNINIKHKWASEKNNVTRNKKRQN